MNERIKELYEQSLIRETGKDHSGNPMLVIKQNPEKFAELIVLECVKAVMNGTKEGDHYAQRIEQHFDNGAGGVLHFGVEE